MLESSPYSDRFASNPRTGILAWTSRTSPWTGTPSKSAIAGKREKPPVKLGNLRTERSVLTEGRVISLGCTAVPSNQHNSPLLRPTLEKLSRFSFDLQPQITVHLGAATAVQIPALCSPKSDANGRSASAVRQFRPAPDGSLNEPTAVTTEDPNNF